MMMATSFTVTYGLTSMPYPRRARSWSVVGRRLVRKRASTRKAGYLNGTQPLKRYPLTKREELKFQEHNILDNVNIISHTIAANAMGINNSTAIVMGGHALGLPRAPALLDNTLGFLPGPDRGAASGQRVGNHCFLRKINFHGWMCPGRLQATPNRVGIYFILDKTPSKTNAVNIAPPLLSDIFQTVRQERGGTDVLGADSHVRLDATARFSILWSKIIAIPANTTASSEAKIYPFSCLLRPNLKLIYDASNATGSYQGCVQNQIYICWLLDSAALAVPAAEVIGDEPASALFPRVRVYCRTRFSDL